MFELETGLIDRGSKLNCDKSFLHFNVKKKYMQRVNLKEQSQSDCKYWILETASLNI